ncbi:O-antigen polymerase [Bacillus sp. 31A1R]|uniref:O-antigen polymerase n=1 Tax=Robertmurraya mangrovi TaxID=3098077 RepID=A0ABU5J1L1_9BACI|nr:O-antigen polymerase [Bacillus sp. 31A1R]MDZ5473314.1 O-antigen polymerase [Bacillus sp. 31A1R]
MEQSKIVGTIIFSLVYLIIGISIIIFTPHHLTDSEYANYLTLTMCYFIVAGLFLLSYIATNMNLFEPIIFVTFLYLMIFSIIPIINIIKGDTLFFGKDIMGGAKKATWIFVTSYIAFLVGYYFKKNTPKMKENIDKKSIGRISYDESKITLISLIFWIIFFLLSLIDLIISGKNILYILTIGTLGDIDSSRKIDAPTGFVSMFGYSMIPIWMYIFAYSKNSFLKKVLYVLTLIVFIVIGFRFVIVILIMAPIIYYYIKNKKTPNIILLIFLGVIMMFMIGLIGFMRGDVRYGNETQWDSFNFDFVMDAVIGNFNLYQPFYGMVEVIPDQLGYSFGAQIFVYTIIMFIPRAIWPNKPYSNLDEVLAKSVTPYASDAGIAFPNIGEFYLEFGIVGCIVFMFFFGKLCGWAKILYQGKNTSVHSLIAYSIFLPSLMQLIIRGYTPSNFYLMVFLLLPIIIIESLTKKGGDYREHSRKSN